MTGVGDTGVVFGVKSTRGSVVPLAMSIKGSSVDIQDTVPTKHVFNKCRL